MKKVLLVFEEYGEMTRTQTYLRKVGFDVYSISNELLLSEQVISFRPDLIVAYGKGQKVSSLSVGQRLRENTKYIGKVILVLPSGMRPTPVEMARLRVDFLMEAPIQAMRLIHAISKLTDMDPQPLLEKYSKAQLSESTKPESFSVKSSEAPESLGQTIHVSGRPIEGFGNIKIEDHERVQKYDRFVAGIKFDKSQTSHNKTLIKEKQAELKKGWDFDLLEEIDRIKREFVTALFRKKG